MVRSIEIPEPLFGADVHATWDTNSDESVYTFKVMVGGTFPVFERTYRAPGDDYSRGEDYFKTEFLSEFAEKFKALLA